MFICVYKCLHVFCAFNVGLMLVCSCFVLGLAFDFVFLDLVLERRKLVCLSTIKSWI